MEKSFDKLSEICNTVLQKFQPRLEAIGTELAHVLRNELKKNGMLKRNISRFAIDNVLEEAKLDMGMGFAFADEKNVPYKKSICDGNCKNCTVYNIHEEIRNNQNIQTGGD